MRIFLRIVVMLLALAGAGGAGFIAVVIQTSHASDEKKLRDQFGVASMDELNKSPQWQLLMALSPPQKVAEINQEYINTKRSSSAVWFLYGAAALGLCGVFLVLFQEGISAAILLLVAAIGPLILLPPEKWLFLLIFIGALPVAGLLAFFVRRKPRSSLITAEA